MLQAFFAHLATGCLAPVRASDNVHVTVVQVEPFHERVQLASCTGFSTVNKLNTQWALDTVMLAREFRCAPSIVIARVPRVVTLAFLCEAPWVILRRADVQVIGVTGVSLKQIAVDLWLNLEDVQVSHVCFVSKTEKLVCISNALLACNVVVDTPTLLCFRVHGGGVVVVHRCKGCVNTRRCGIR